MTIELENVNMSMKYIEINGIIGMRKLMICRRVHDWQVNCLFKEKKKNKRNPLMEENAVGGYLEILKIIGQDKSMT